MGVVDKLLVGEGGSWGDGDACPAAGTGWWIKFQVALRSPHLQAWSIRWTPTCTFTFETPKNGSQVRVVSGSFWWLRRKKERTKDDSDVATSVKYRVALFSSWSKSVCNPETSVTRIRGPPRLLPPFKGEHLEWVQTSWLAPISPNDKPLGSHMIGWKYLVSPRYPHYD